MGASNIKTTVCKLSQRKEKQAQENINLSAFSKKSNNDSKQCMEIKDDSSFKAHGEDQKRSSGKAEWWWWQLREGGAMASLEGGQFPSALSVAILQISS